MIRSIIRPFLLTALVAVAVLTFHPSTTSAQVRYYDVWYFGDGLGLDFRNGAPSLIGGSVRTEEGCSSICDPNTGEPLFYTNGVTIYSRDQMAMMDGDDLYGHRSASQSALIVPDPGKASRFYVFTVDAWWPAPPKGRGLNYSIVDIEANGGLGRVTEKNVNLFKAASEKLIGVRHCNGRDFWIITHEFPGSRFYAWLLTAKGISATPVISDVGLSYGPGTPAPDFDAGTLKASPDGTMLFASRINVVGEGLSAELFRFDPSTGNVGPKIEDLSGGFDGAFSHDNAFLYSSTLTTVIRYDLRLSPGTIAQSRRTIGEAPDSRYIGGIQLAPDSNIYLTYSNSSGHMRIGRVSNPGLPGDDVGFTPGLFWFDNDVRPFSSLPNCIEGFWGESEVAGPFTLSGDTTICRGGSALLRATGHDGYRWSPAEGLSCTECADPVAMPSKTTQYRVIAQSEETCVGFDTLYVTVDVSELPTVSAGEDRTICRGESVQLNVSGGVRWLWEPADGLSCTDCSNPTVSPAGTTTYIVEGFNDAGCAGVDSVTVTVVPSPVADAGVDVTICAGGSAQLQAGGGISYRWSPADGLSCTDCPSPVASPATTTTYRVTVTNEADCISMDEVTVTVIDDLEMLQSDTTICLGKSIRLEASGRTDYRWSPADGLSCTDCPDPIASPTSTTTYYVIGSNASGVCPALDSVRITVVDPPVADAGIDTAVCAGATVRLSASGGDTYRWNTTPDLSCLDCADPIVSPTESTTYYVTVTNSQGCEDTDSVRVAVDRAAVVAAGDDRTICAGDVVRLEAKGGIRWQWEPADGLSCTDCPDPIASPSTTTTYRVTGWSDEGCEGSDEVTVVVRESKEILRLRIGRDHRGTTGQPLTIPVEIVDSIGSSDVSEFELTLEYDPAVMLIDEASIERGLEGTALEGWSVEIVESMPGRLRMLLTAPAGETLSGRGTLLRFESSLYLSNVLGTEIPLRVVMSSRCFEFVTEPGYAKVDSVCGMNFRLIELTAQKYVAPVAYPNPASDRVRFEFGLGLDGPTRLEVFDLSGKRVGLIVNEPLEPGRYSVEWDVRDVAAGMYWYRLSSGDWSEEGQLRIQR